MTPDLFVNPETANLGSLGLAPYIPSPPLPNLIAEWAAIIPLITHLASPRDDHIITGEIALRGYLTVGLFPRLGTFSAYYRLLTRGTKFLDYASSRGGSSRTVWDVTWGSVFPSANGAASTAVLTYLMDQAGNSPPRKMPEKYVKPEVASSDTPGSSEAPKNNRKRSIQCVQQSESRKGSQMGIAADDPKDADLERLPILPHPVQKTSPPRPPTHAPPRTLVPYPRRLRPGWSLHRAGPLRRLRDGGAGALRRHLGNGSRAPPRATTADVSAQQRGTRRLHAAGAAPERHRVEPPRRRPRRRRQPRQQAAVPSAGAWFAVANALQLAAMTYVAAQKGWDEFGGRWAMLGAVHVFRGTGSARWMDDIIVPHARREAWLRCLQGLEGVDGVDAELVGSMEEAARAASDVLKQEFNEVRFSA